jgi:hypothetical protein
MSSERCASCKGSFSWPDAPLPGLEHYRNKPAHCSVCLKDFCIMCGFGAANRRGVGKLVCPTCDGDLVFSGPSSDASVIGVALSSPETRKRVLDEDRLLIIACVTSIVWGVIGTAIAAAVGIDLSSVTSIGDPATARGLFQLGLLHGFLACMAGWLGQRFLRDSSLTTALLGLLLLGGIVTMLRTAFGAEALNGSVNLLWILGTPIAAPWLALRTFDLWSDLSTARVFSRKR